MMAFLFSSSILILLSLGLPSMVSRDRMGRHPPKGRAGGVFLLARRTLLWCPRKPSVRCALVLRRRGCGLSKGWAGSSLTSLASDWMGNGSENREDPVQGAYEAHE